VVALIFTQEVQLGTEVVQGVHRPSLKPGVEIGEAIERPLLQSMCKVEEKLTLQLFEGFRKECVQGSSLRFEVVRELRRDNAFETIEGNTRSWCISSD
jgi:hypothetical protein